MKLFLLQSIVVLLLCLLMCLRAEAFNMEGKLIEFKQPNGTAH
ncbi:MAG: hypothetical protein ACSHX0_04735 [Akkermansiaceae bacterium]